MVASFSRVRSEVDKLQKEVKALQETITRIQRREDEATKAAAASAALAATRAATAAASPSGRPVSMHSTSSGDEPMYRPLYEAFKPGDVGRMAMAAAHAQRLTAPNTPNTPNDGAGAAVDEPPSPDGQSTPTRATSGTVNDPFAPTTPGKRAHLGDRTHSANAALNIPNGTRNLHDFVLSDAVLAEDDAASGGGSGGGAAPPKEFFFPPGIGGGGAVDGAGAGSAVETDAVDGLDSNSYLAMETPESTFQFKLLPQRDGG